jgi:hypothetical protein
MIPATNQTARFNIGVRQLNMAQAEIVRKNAILQGVFNVLGVDIQAYTEAVEALGMQDVMPELKPALVPEAQLVMAQTQLNAAIAKMNAVANKMDEIAAGFNPAAPNALVDLLNAFGDVREMLN